MDQPGMRMEPERSSARGYSRRLRAALASGGVLVVTAILLGIAPAATKAGAADKGDFRRDLLPILSEACSTCPGPDAKTRKADLRLDLKESALRAQDRVIVPGASGESELVVRVTSRDPDEVMPPPESGKKLTAAQIE